MVLDIIFGFLLGYHPSVAVLIFSFIVLVLINIFYKILINQNDAKQLKEKTKELNKQMKEARKAGKKDEADKMLGEMMSENSRLMRMTMKPMIVSLIIVVLMLPWLSSNYETSSGVTNSSGTINLTGSSYTFSVNDSSVTIDGLSEYDGVCDGKCFYINGTKYEASRDKGGFMSGGDRVKLSTVVAVFPISLPVIGYDIGWLGWYILVSVPLVILIRKFMKIYV